MWSRLCLLAVALKLCALQTEERTRSRCCWFINTTRKLLMVSALFVLANYKGAKSSKLTTMIILRNPSASLSALEQSWCAVGFSQQCQQFLGSPSDVPQLQVTAVSTAPYSTAYSSIVYGQYSHRTSSRSLGQIHHKHCLERQACSLRTGAIYQVSRL